MQDAIGSNLLEIYPYKHHNTRKEAKLVAGFQTSPYRKGLKAFASRFVSHLVTMCNLGSVSLFVLL